MGNPALKSTRGKEAVLADKVTRPAARKRVAQPQSKPAVSVETSSAPKRSSAGLISVFKSSGGGKISDFRSLYRSSPDERIELIRAGVGAVETKAFAVDLGIPQDRFFRMFGIAQATVTRKASKQQPMSSEESEKIVGMAKLVGQLQTILEQSGDPELMKDFDAAKWLAKWIEESIPAFGGKRPADYMDTIEGQEMVSRLLSMMQAGAYA